MVAHHLPDLTGALVEDEKIVLEDLDPIEAGPGYRLQLAAQVAAERDGGDRGLHACLLRCPVVRRSER
ncbi:hypothetical protein D3C87_1957440 [compost metagenome]